jgi:hypothetical protein
MTFKAASSLRQPSPVLPATASRSPGPQVGTPAAGAFSRAQAASAVDSAVKGDARETALARRDAAAGIEALHRIYNGIDRASPARGMNHGRPVALAIPRDLNDAFRRFLVHPSQPSDHFRADDPHARPNAAWPI